MTTDLREHLQASLGSAYSLDRELSGGGMSHVFVARDQTLGRDVVVKVLPPDAAAALSADRFKREIALAARLQHPNIVPVLSAGVTADGLPFYTMPFVEGESLRQRLARGGELPVAEVVSVLRDVLRALAYAHARDVIHRDVKPDNVMLSGGVAVVTDFGVAKAVSASTTAAGTTSLTQMGVALGTPAYMAPEQAAADPAVDRRADLYAVGCVAYEMLTGSPPFTGRPVPALLAAQISELPEHVTRRRPNVPLALAALVMHCLEKRAADRPRDAVETLYALESVMVVAPTGVTAAGLSPAPRAWSARFRDPVVAGAVAVAVVAAGVLAWSSLPARQRREATARVRFTLDLPPDARLNPTGPGYTMALSRDGSSFAYVGGAPERRLYVRRLDAIEPRAIPGTEDAAHLRFSFDGRWIGFARDNVIYKVPVDGGPPVRVANGEGRFDWTPDGSLVYRHSAGGVPGLWRVAPGGAPERITVPDSMRAGNHTSPTVLPDGRTVVFTSTTTEGTTLMAVRLDERRPVSLGVPGGGPVYLDGGYLVFHDAGAIRAVRFDPERLTVLGEPVTMIEGVTTKPSGASEFALAPNGTLAYLPGTSGRDLVMVDRRGGGARVLIAGSRGNVNYGSPRVSPDGRRVALTYGRPPFQRDVRIHDIDAGTTSPLTRDGRSGDAVWTPDGRRLAWSAGAADREGIWWQPWDESAPAELLLPGGHDPEFTPRGDTLIASVRVDGGRELRLIPLPVSAGRPARTVLAASSGSRQQRLSPDGRLLAYVSSETGVREVWVQAFPGPGGRRQVSSGGGVLPVWAPGGQELFYRSGAAVISATIATSPEIAVLGRDTLFRSSQGESPYDVTRDGKQFIMTRLAGSAASPVVVVGWGNDVRERLAAAGVAK